MKGQNFTKVAPHIQTKRKGAGAMGTMESARMRMYNKMKIILDFGNYNDELLNICEEIKYWLDLNEKSQLELLDYMDNLTKRANELGIYYIDDNKSTLMDIEKKILKMTKKYILKKIQKELLEFEENFSYEGLKKIKELIIKAKKLKITDINEDLSLEDLGNKTKDFSQKEYVFLRLEEKLNKILNNPSILDIEYFEYDLHEAKIEGIDIGNIELTINEALKKLVTLESTYLD